MIFWVTGPITANNLTSIVSQNNKRAIAIPFESKSLLPNSIYTFWINGSDMTWACRQYGTKLGSGLRSDNTGTLSFDFHTEILQIPLQHDMTKYYNCQLKDISGNMSAITVMRQSLKYRVI